jgi:hypothetical protein
VSSMRGACFVALAVTACAARARPAASTVDASIALYRGAALVEERLAVAIDDAGVGVVPLAGELATATIEVDGELGAIASWTRTAARPGDPIEAQVGGEVVVGRLGGVGADGVHILTATGSVIVRPEVLTSPSATLRITSPRRGQTVTVVVRYQTASLTWDASYSLVERDGRAALRGAIALDNRTGRAWRQAQVTVVDADLTTPTPAEAWARLHPLSLGPPRRVGLGTQRLEVALPTAAVPVAAVLTYAPRSPDNNRDDLSTEPRVIREPATPRVDTALAFTLPPAAVLPLPSGPVRVVSLDDDGAPTWRGQVDLTPAAPDAERTVAIPVGVNPDVTGTWRQTMFDLDYQRERMVEEITIRLTNRGRRAARVVAREQLYRGLCWTLAYYSTPEVAKEGPQQIRLVTEVPAGATQAVVYRVVYKRGACPP